MSPGAEVTRLGATDLGAEVPGQAQQAILGGVHVANTSVPQIVVPSSAPCILDPKPSFPCRRYSHFFIPSWFLLLPTPAQSLESTNLTLDTWI